MNIGSTMDSRSSTDLTDQAPDDSILQAKKEGNEELLGKLLEEYRLKLHLRAESQLHGVVGRKVGASDIVQQSFLQAFRAFAHFEGLSRPEFTAWLNRILDRELAQVVRKHLATQKRDLKREQSIPSESGSDVMGPQLAANQSSPSQRVMRQESNSRIEAVLDELPPAQREAVRLRYLEGFSLTEIAERLDRTTIATAGLIQRGLAKLRNKLNSEEETLES